MKKAILGSLAVLPLAAAGVLANAGAANAVALVGDFQISSFQTKANVSLTSVDFFTEPNEVFIPASTGTFDSLGFSAASIKDIVEIPNAGSNINNPFLDLGFFGDEDSITDVENIFQVKNVENYQFLNAGSGTTISIGFAGDFISETGEITLGTGNLTFQVAGKSAAQTEALLNSGQTLTDVTFSGAFISATAVPEPATMLGLGVVAGSLALSRAGKKNKA